MEILPRKAAIESYRLSKFRAPAGASGRWLAFGAELPAATNQGAAEDAARGLRALVVGGWNGSYHDPYYAKCQVVGYGRTPAEARRAARKAADAIRRGTDTTGRALVPAASRAQVRPGD